MVTATPATSVRDVADLPLADTPLVPIRGASGHGGDPCPDARRRGPIEGRGTGGAGPRPGREGDA
jgi:hypothetical protein